MNVPNDYRKMDKLEIPFRETAARFPDRLAVQFGDHRLTYGELADLWDVFAQKTGFLAGMRVVLLLPDGIASYLYHLHLFLAGAVVVPVSVYATTSRIRALCDKIYPHFVVTTDLLRIRHGTAFEGVCCLAVKSNTIDGLFRFTDISASLEDLTEPRQSSETEAEDVRLIVFTSGSTGEPKGVCLNESNILAAARMNVSFLGLDPSRKSLVTVPLYDYYGFIQIYAHLLAGCGCILGESIALPAQIFERILVEKVTDLVLVPHTLRQILRHMPKNGQEAIRSLQYMTSSSDALTPEILSRTFEINPELKIFNIYGLTEAGRACSRKIEESSGPSNSIGRPSPGVEIKIDGPAGEPGEIIIRGPNVMRGYFQQIDGGRVIFNSCTELRTGDLGYFNDHGEIILLGRKDHMFNIKGVKIHPVEIERTALQAVGVADAQARTRLHPDGEVFIILDVVPSNGACDLAEIREHLRRNLSPCFFPREINMVDTIKRTDLGSKIIRRQECA